MDQLEEEQLSAAKAVGAAPPPSATPAAVTPVMTAEYLDLSDSCPDLSAGQSNCHSKVSYSYAVGGHQGDIFCQGGKLFSIHPQYPSTDFSERKSAQPYLIINFYFSFRLE